MKPTIGRTVIYDNNSEKLPAIIVGVNSDTNVNLQVLRNDGLSGGVQWKQNVEQGDDIWQWNWPVISK